MEIQGIQATGLQSMFQSQESDSLTEEEISALEEILSSYDTENLSEEEQASMMAEIEAAGIEPSQELGQILNEAGVTPPEKAGGVEEMGPPPPPPESEDSEEASSIRDLLSKYDSGEIDEDELATQVSGIKETMTESTGVLIDESA